MWSFFYQMKQRCHNEAMNWSLAAIDHYTYCSSQSWVLWRGKTSTNFSKTRHGRSLLKTQFFILLYIYSSESTRPVSCQDPPRKWLHRWPLNFCHSSSLYIFIFRHPKHCKEGIPYAQATRIRRICSSLEAFQLRSKELRCFLVARGYKDNFVKAQIWKAKSKSRVEVLGPYIKEKNERIPFVTMYHPSLPNIGGLTRELQPILHCSKVPECSTRSTDGF